MKDIESSLWHHPPVPARQVSQDFTKRVISGIHNGVAPGTWRTLRDTLWLKPIGKVGILSLAIVMVISGTVAAITLWPQLSVTPVTHEKMSNGNRIVGYDVQNCDYFSHPEAAHLKPTKEKVYYEVRHDSALSDQQIQDGLRAMCEENISNGVSMALSGRTGDNTHGLQSTVTYTIQHITPKTITVSPDPHYDMAQYTLKPDTTYTRFAGDMRTYDRGTEVAYSEFKAGDTIKMIVQDTSGISTETPENYNPMNHPENIVVTALLKVPPLTADAAALYAAIGKDIVRMEPCTTTPAGLCKVYNFAP